jgi:Mor family transcriptional regulator
VKRNKNGSMNIALDIVEACSGSIGRKTAVKGIRKLCLYLGGAMYYIPAKKKKGISLKEIYEILGEAVGSRATEIIVDKIMALYGGLQVYIPFERTAFEDVIAEEIYHRYTEENVPMREMCRDYFISFTKVYQLWRKGRKIKLSKEMKK